MTNKPDISQNDEIYKIPFINAEYERYRVLKQKTRILCAMAVTNIIWLIFVLAIVFFR